MESDSTPLRYITTKRRPQSLHAPVTTETGTQIRDGFRKENGVPVAMISCCCDIKINCDTVEVPDDPSTPNARRSSHEEERRRRRRKRRRRIRKNKKTKKKNKKKKKEEEETIKNKKKIHKIIQTRRRRRRSQTKIERASHLFRFGRQILKMIV